MSGAMDWFASRRGIALAVVAVTAALTAASQAHATPLTGVDLSTYQRVARYDLPEPTRTPAPAGSLLAQEASAVTYDWDTDTLFVVGDGGTSVVQVSKTGQLINSMTLAAGSSPQGTEFYDTEGLAYAGGGKFVFTEERYRQLDLFTYAPGTTLTRAQVQTVKLGTTIGNTGLEGVTNDPFSGGFVVVKETQPEGIFQTNVDWSAGTATNGSPTTDESTNLFDPALAGLNDFSDVFSLSNLSTLSGADTSHLLILSQESGKIVNVDRSGRVYSTLTIPTDAGNPLSVPDQTHEGVTMDNDGRLYDVNEAGGGDSNHPQLWVYAPSTAPDQAPTAVALTHPLQTIAATTSTAQHIKVADVAVSDDGLGTNNLAVTGPDASSFEVDSTGLYLKAGTTLTAGKVFNVSVTVDDPSVGSTPDATSAPLSLTVTATAAPTSLIVSEVSPWSSGNSSYGADWWELTNTGSQPVDLTGYRMDDNSNSIGNAVALNGVPSIAPGQSVIFIEGSASTAAAFKAFWNLPALPVGYYSGSGVGLSTDGDAVNIFDGVGNRVTGVQFGTSTTYRTFDNSAGQGSATLPLPMVSQLSAAGVDGAWQQGAEIGSPGTIAPKLIVSEISPWSSGNSPYAADWWELTNLGAHPVDLTGFKMDDNSNAFANAVALNGVSSIAPGQSVIFIEGNASTAAAFKAFWNLPALPVGYYSGSGVGLSTDGDEVHVFDGTGRPVTGVRFGASTTSFTFDNAAGLPVVSQLSVAGVNGAFLNAGETGSPGTVSPNPVAPVGGTVPATLSLTLGPAATFAPFIPGVAKDYTAQTTATVTSSAGDATLSVSDPGHLTNGAFALPQPLQVGFDHSTWTGPVSNDPVTITFEQSIAADDALRTGTYARTVTFTLSTTNP